MVLIFQDNNDEPTKNQLETAGITPAATCEEVLPTNHTPLPSSVSTKKLRPQWPVLLSQVEVALPSLAEQLILTINSYSNPNELVYETLKIIATTLKVEYALLLQHDARSKALVAVRPVYSVFAGQSPEAEAALEGLKIDLEESSTSAQAFLTRQTIYLNGPAATLHTNKNQTDLVNIRNVLAIPIVLEGTVQGVCCLLNKTAAGFDEADQQLVESQHFAIANLLKNVLLIEKVERQQHRHNALLDIAVDGFVEVSRDMRITSFSKGAEALTGWKAEEAQGRSCQEVLLPHTPDNELLCNNCPLRRSFRTGLSILNVEALIKDQEGEDNWVSCSYNAVTDERGQVTSGIITIRDIYRLKALSDELRQQAHQLESLLGVNNAINGLSNIEDIYLTSLEEIAKAIDFDLGTIHSVNYDNKGLLLEALVERDIETENGQAANLSELSQQSPELLELALLKARIADEESDLSLEEDGVQRHSRLHSPGTRRQGTVSLARDNRKDRPRKLHHADECEALRQNEPYMAVSLPGKAVCGALSEFNGLLSHLCVPIKTNERTYGVLHLASRKPYAFLGSDFVLALSIAKQIAVAAERARLFAQVDRLARTDALTGLYNKREFWERLTREMRRADRRQSSLSLIMIDLDRLKWINDCFGHSEGDFLLMRLGEIFRAEGRAGDTAFRYGGDEFCILLPDTSLDEAKVAAERLQMAALKLRLSSSLDQIIIGEESIVTMSVGIACYPQDARTPEDFFKTADAAMYRAKETGKDRVVLFDPQIDLSRLSYRHLLDTDKPINGA